MPSIRDWPDDERPREKLLLRGASALSDAELLAIFLRVGVKGRSAVDLARDMLKEHGGLRRLLELDQTAFCATHGLGMAKYVQLQAVLELAQRHLKEILQRGDVIQSVADTRRYFMVRMRHHPHEVFSCLFLDNKHRVIDYEELFFGTIDSSSVHPRQVVKRALYHNAAAAIVAHNHPSGIAEPSRADELITVRLKEALALVDVRLLDHIVVGDSQVVSLAERGVL
jgi:DNA repair protein RadC